MVWSLMTRCGLRRVVALVVSAPSNQMHRLSSSSVVVVGNNNHLPLYRTFPTKTPTFVLQQPQQPLIRFLASRPRLFSSTGKPTSGNNIDKMTDTEFKETKEQLKKRLTSLAYQVTQEAGTERPFSGKYDKFNEEGQYQCIVCHQDLFSSKTKFDAGCGWPAFNDVLDQGKITLHRDASIADRIRTEVRCAKCNAHMGHVFEDGPPPTRKRYCINSVAIDFVPAKSS